MGISFSRPAFSAASRPSGARAHPRIRMSAVRPRPIPGATAKPWCFDPSRNRPMALKAARRSAIPPFIAMEVLAAANAREAAGVHVLHLEVGQPDSAAPAPVLEAAQRALKSHRLGYTEALGITPLREAIAGYYQSAYAIAVDPARVVVTTGSSGAFLLAFLAAFDPGDRVALAAPGYPAYRNILLALGLEPVDLPCGPETRFQPTPAMLEAVDGRLDGLIVASPSNPAGSMLSPADL